mmetsp:Transcript_87439/g.283093  ORF Transcript_87439/g.283093 Transcript_87439/m.283093 type:complete len:319 (+) Transcript_87439:98-1054(+)
MCAQGSHRHQQLPRPSGTLWGQSLATSDARPLLQTGAPLRPHEKPGPVQLCLQRAALPRFPMQASWPPWVYPPPAAHLAHRCLHPPCYRQRCRGRHRWRGHAARALRVRAEMPPTPTHRACCSPPVPVRWPGWSRRGARSAERQPLRVCPEAGPTANPRTPSSAGRPQRSPACMPDKPTLRPSLAAASLPGHLAPFRRKEQAPLPRPTRPCSPHSGWAATPPPHRRSWSCAIQTVPSPRRLRNALRQGRSAMCMPHRPSCLHPDWPPPRCTMESARRCQLPPWCQSSHRQSGPPPRQHWPCPAGLSALGRTHLVAHGP